MSLRGLSGSQIGEAISDGFHRNSKAQMGALSDRLLKLNGMFPAVVEGDEIVMTYAPGKGTIVSAKGAEKGKKVVFLSGDENVRSRIERQ